MKTIENDMKTYSVRQDLNFFGEDSKENRIRLVECCNDPMVPSAMC